MGYVIIIILSIGDLSFFYAGKPRAIDVYKGNTTLEITYKDKAPIDSTVAWKNR